MIDLKGKRKFGLGVVIMELRDLKYLVKRRGTVILGPVTRCVNLVT